MDKQDRPNPEEQDIARLLRAAGPREELPPQLKRQWEQQFRAELQPVLERRRQRRRRVVFGLCASVALVAVALSFNWWQPAVPQTIIRVSHVIGEHRLQSDDKDEKILRPGQLLIAGSAISTGENGYITLDYNGYDLRLNSSTRVEFAAQSIELKAGEIYVSNEVRAISLNGLRINTPQGVIRDIGTQFTVALLPGETVTTVRRGAVLVHTGNADFHAESQPDSAARVTVRDDRQVYEARVEPSGDQWQWIYQGTPGFELEGRSAYDFLQWSVAESGLLLEFATQGAKVYASHTLLHGDFGDLNPEQAVNPVLSATDLEAQRIAKNTLLVSLKPVRQ